MSTFEELLKTKRMNCTGFIQRLQNEGRIIDLCEIDDVYYMTFAYEVPSASILNYDNGERNWSVACDSTSTFVYGAFAVDGDNRILKMIYNVSYKNDDDTYVHLKPQIIKTSDDIKLQQLFDKEGNMALVTIDTKISSMFSRILKGKLMYTPYQFDYYRHCLCNELHDEYKTSEQKANERADEIIDTVKYHNGIKEIIHEFGITYTDNPVLVAKPTHVKLFDCVMTEDDITTFEYIEKILSDSSIKEHLAAAVQQAQLTVDSSK